ncbi:MFS transporter [Chitinophaga sancti]|uniref:MFS transporter n=1 Tax=Chitinophaga sancti TaxID=1004 RepID=A0A1K1R5J4_9BACT|nr:MFS transporter [Chitinophaga sancti]WQD64220.1 MFS transporter [Chitinophaga sancti]WQG90156.1 MFS transporter [Chitinophaga sancti]SFW67376.1 Predicted arabinose efflux permease, MFS family [Chitinophaga sancti]
MKRIAYIGCLGMIGVITTEFGVIGILPQLAEHYHISIEKAGILLSAFAMVIALTGPFMTLLASEFDRKKVMMTAISIFLITGIVSAFAPPFWLLLLVRILPAFLQPVYIAVAIAAATSGVNDKIKNEMMGIVLGGIAITMVTTVPLATWLAGRLNWQASFLVQALVTMIALIAIWKGLPTMPVKEKKSYGSQLSILKNKTFIISTTMNFFMIAAWFSTYSYFADYISKTKNMTGDMASYMLLLFGITGVLSNWLAGKLLGRSIPITAALFLSGTVIIPFALYLSEGSTIATVAVIAIWGFFYAPCFLNASAYMISAAPNALEFANSLATSFGNLGVAVGTTVSGWFIFHSGVAIAPWVGAVFGVAAIAMVGLRYLLERKQRI